MITPIEIFFQHCGKKLPDIEIFLNNKLTNYKVSTTVNEYGHYSIYTETDLNKAINNLVIRVTGLAEDISESISIKEIFANNIRFGLVTFLCTTVNGQQCTMISYDGSINIEIGFPVWEFFCIRLNEFNYKDYPLGSTN